MNDEYVTDTNPLITIKNDRDSDGWGDRLQIKGYADKDAEFFSYISMNEQNKWTCNILTREQTAELYRVLGEILDT